jgi:hypothetical protein
MQFSIVSMPTCKRSEGVLLILKVLSGNSNRGMIVGSFNPVKNCSPTFFSFNFNDSISREENKTITVQRLKDRWDGFVHSKWPYMIFLVSGKSYTILEILWDGFGDWEKRTSQPNNLGRWITENGQIPEMTYQEWHMLKLKIARIRLKLQGRVVKEIEKK